MADQIYYSVFTQQGLELLTEAIRNGTKLGITSMAFGDGDGDLPIPDASFHELVNEVYRTPLNSLAPDPNNKNWLRAEAIIASAIGGFNIRELGLYAGNVLVAYSNYPATYKPNPADGTARIMTFRMILQIDNTSNFELIIDPDIVLATINFVHEQIKKLTVDSIDELLKIQNPQSGMKVEVISYHEGFGYGGGTFIYSEEKMETYDGIKCFYGWERISNKLNIFDAGATNLTNSTAALEISSIFAKQNNCKIEIPAGTMILADNSNFDTSVFWGDGDIKHESSSIVMNNEFRKKLDQYNSKVITLEDEFGYHNLVDDNDLRYTAFGSACLSMGKEYIAVRSGINHYMDNSIPGCLVLYTLYRNQTKNKITKKILMTAPTGKDIRDVNISVHPENGNRLLIKYVLKTGTSTYENYLITYDSQDEKVISSRKFAFDTLNQFSWGNTLISPSGYLLSAHYGNDGKTTISRSTNVFDINANTDITMQRIRDFEPNSSAEPTLTYWNDRLIAIYRMPNGINGKYAYTFDKEGIFGWSQNFTIPREIHAPAVEPYCDSKDELTFAFSLGSARSIIATASTQNLENWFITANIFIAGEITLKSGQSGGYPSFVDYGENISISSYADVRHQNGKLSTRFEVKEIKKASISAKNSISSQINFLKLSFNDCIESLGTNSPYTDIIFGLKSKFDGKGFLLKLVGQDTATKFDILDQTGNIIYSVTKDISLVNPEIINLLFSTNLSMNPGIYTLRIYGAGKVNPLIRRFNTKRQVKKNIVKSEHIDIIDLKTYGSSIFSSSSTYIDLIF